MLANDRQLAEPRQSPVTLALPVQQTRLVVIEEVRQAAACPPAMLRLKSRPKTLPAELGRLAPRPKGQAAAQEVIKDRLEAEILHTLIPRRPVVHHIQTLRQQAKQQVAPLTRELLTARLAYDLPSFSATFS